MSAIDDLFGRLRAENQKAFIPFITAGDPNLAVTKAILEAFDAQGCHLAEIGLPYSDPIADGPTIQASYTRALADKIKVPDIFSMLSEVKSLSMPRVCMTSYSIVHRLGEQKFLEMSTTSGLAGAIIPDLPLEESPRFAGLCKEHDFSLIQLVTPMTPRDRALRIAENSSGFLYFVSVTGITGTRDSLPEDLLQNVAWMKEQTSLPVCVGFGISRPDHVRELRDVADGLIVGSGIVRHLESCDPANPEETIQKVSNYVGEMIAALK
ncbi:Tryptophan synthase alpha chain [Planctomycetales bacterium 10988]|nr:Tryptophan synthase alpha chain [Planctomycetales bacterium 10988]